MHQANWHDQATRSSQATATSVTQMQSKIDVQGTTIAALQKRLSAKQAQVNVLKATVTGMAEAMVAKPTATATPLVTKNPVSATITAGNIGKLRKMPTFAFNTYGWVASVAIASDGKAIVVGQISKRPSTGSNCFVWQEAQNRWRDKTFNDLPNVYSVAFLRDGDQLAIGHDKGVAIANKPFASTISLAGAPGGIKAVAYSDRFLAAGGDNGVFVWPLPVVAGSAAGKQILNKQITSVAFSPHNTQLAIGGAQGALWLCSVSLYNGTITATRCNQPLNSQVHKRKVWALAFTPDGQWLAAGSQDGIISIWEIDGYGSITMSKKVSLSIVYDLAFSPNGKLLIAATERGIAAWKFNAGDLTAIQKLPSQLQKQAGSVAISSDGTSLIVGFQGGVEMWSVP